MKITKEGIHLLKELIEKGQSIEPHRVRDLVEAYEDVTRFENPKPVVVGIIPIVEDGVRGLLAIERGEGPISDSLGLPKKGWSNLKGEDVAVSPKPKRTKKAKK